MRACLHSLSAGEVSMLVDDDAHYFVHQLLCDGVGVLGRHSRFFFFFFFFRAAGHGMSAPFIQPRVREKKMSESTESCIRLSIKCTNEERWDRTHLC